RLAMKRVPLLRPAYFIWIALPAALYAGYLALGDPYVIWSWTASSAGGHGYPTFRAGNHITCTYVGWPGTLREPAEGGQCALLRFSKAGWQ
ncbi:hypothetical protein, partial [Jiella marina]|uniref:hypothetical protein n=1 Tax=Jiella sp. LLJ827 TaxID=2917712 RepID=UPI002101AF8A